MAKIQGPKERKPILIFTKKSGPNLGPWAKKIYPKVHKNPRAFFSSSSPILLESSIQYHWGVGLHHPLHLRKDLTLNPEVLHTLGSFPRHL